MLLDVPRYDDLIEKTLVFPKYYSQDLVKFVLELIDVDPRKRSSIKELMVHPFVISRLFPLDF